MGGLSLPVFVVSEFQPSAVGIGCTWIPWMPSQPFEENLARVRWRLRRHRIRFSCILLQPRMPYWTMRWAGLRIAPLRVYCFNENYGHFPLHPRGALSLARHCLWRAKNWLRYQSRPGGEIYTLIWRLGHPFSWERPFYAWKARRRRPLSTAPLRREDHERLSAGITVVIPSRDGRALLEKLLPQVLAEPEVTRVVIVDNGSSDATPELSSARVDVLVEDHPLSFAAAVNRGIRACRTTHVCLLNNDMEIEPGFFAALRAAFDRVPDLFCSTAQIFFPPGQRRQETGKAVYWPQSPRDLPLRCLEPIEGETDSPVLYGSGGCSLYDTAKLREIGCLKEAFRPAYVEDLDVGWRAWQQGWPTVFVAEARVVHHHRSTTGRFFSPTAIELAIEQNYLRWILTSVASPEAFARLWAPAVSRLSARAAIPEPAPVEIFALRFAAFHRPYFAWDRPAAPRFAETEILSLGSGQIACFPGAPSGGKPKLIVATCYLPFPLSHGGAVRIFNLLREAARDYSIVLMSFIDEFTPVAPELLELCHEVVLVLRKGSHLKRTLDLPKAVEDFASDPFAAELRRAVRRWKPFAVQLEFTQMAQYARDCAPAKTLLVEHDITLDLYAQMLRDQEDFDTLREHARWERFERKAWRELNAVVVMSEKDRGMVQEARRVVVLENGVDLERFTPSPQPPEAKRLLFIGSFAHLPNLLALEWFLAEVWPRLTGYCLHVIAGHKPAYWQEFYRGRAQVDLEQPGVELEGFVSDVRGAYRRAELVVAPLLASAGTNIKILEALAMGKAVVSTPGGVNGLGLHPGQDFALAEGAAAFATQLDFLTADTSARCRLELQGRAAVEARFGWSAIGARQKVLYESLRAEAQ